MTDKEKIKVEIERLKESGCASPIVICDTLLAFIDSLQEEPVSEGLEEVARKVGQKYFPDEENIWARQNYEARKAEYAFIEGANWQEEQFEKNRLAHCDALTKEQAQIESDFVTKHLKENNRTPTFIDAIEYGIALKEKEMQSTIELAEDHAFLAGMEKMKEEMMSNAIDGVITFDYYSGDKIYGCIAHDSFCLEDFGLKDRDKVKVLVIKEE